MFAYCSLVSIRVFNLGEKLVSKTLTNFVVFSRDIPRGLDAVLLRSIYNRMENPDVTLHTACLLSVGFPALKA